MIHNPKDMPNIFITDPNEKNEILCIDAETECGAVVILIDEGTYRVKHIQNPNDTSLSCFMKFMNKYGFMPYNY